MSNNLKRFTLVWTLKESFLKNQGLEFGKLLDKKLLDYAQKEYFLSFSNSEYIISMYCEKIKQFKIYYFTYKNNKFYTNMRGKKFRLIK